MYVYICMCIFIMSDKPLWLGVYVVSRGTLIKKFIYLSIKIGYNINVIRQTACMVVNPSTVNNFASLFGCTQVARASDSMTAPA